MNKHTEQAFGAVKAITDISIEEMKSKSRIEDFVHARYCVAAILRKYGYSWGFIGMQIGERDHATALFGVKKFHKILKDKNAKYRLWVLATQEWITSNTEMKAEEQIVNQIQYHESEINRLQKLIN